MSAAHGSSLFKLKTFFNGTFHPIIPSYILILHIQTGLSAQGFMFCAPLYKQEATYLRCIKPFKNTLIGWLDLFFMVNYSAVALVMVHSQSPRSQAIITIIGVLVSTTLVAFICIILYHIYLTCNLRRYCPRTPRVNEAMRGVGGYEPLEGSHYNHVYNAGHEDARFREPLLGSQS